MLTAKYGVAAAGMEWSYKVCEDASSASMMMGSPSSSSDTPAVKKMVVTAELIVSGVTQAEIVASTPKQTAIRRGFASSIAVPANDVKIIKIGSASMRLRNRRLDTFGIEFEIALGDNSEAAANAVKSKIAKADKSAMMAAIAMEATKMGVAMNLKVDDELVVSKVQVREMAGDSASSDSGGGKTDMVAVGAGAGAGGFLLLVAAAFFFCRSKKRDSQTYNNRGLKNNADLPQAHMVSVLAIPEGQYSNTNVNAIPMATVTATDEGPVSLQMVSNQLENYNARK